MLIVSACLAGVKCKYNGEDNFTPLCRELLALTPVQLVCPEQLGGLPTPRVPAEIRGGSGEDVLAGRGRVLTGDGRDVTGAFLRGARETLRVARLLGASGAVLKEGSPSCGSRRIYDGTFQGCRKAGQGVTAALLRREGLEIWSEEDLALLLEKKGG
ncbi:MAG TPA: DUF523 domain-containing protein [Clostridia bacterium]|nr:DUF523 domain-containing protein [Clostridia bacterium]